MSSPGVRGAVAGTGNRPRLLDLFCGAGGAGEGYRRAGFDVVGVDIAPHDYRPGVFVQADALDVLRDETFLAGFDAVHASPPCQAFSSITPEHRRRVHLDLITPVRELLHASGLPYVIENVEGAKRHLRDPFRLCGSSFGLRVRRHRWFESSAPVLALPCRHREQGVPVGVYGEHADPRSYARVEDGSSRGVKALDDADARDALGIDWPMPWLDLAECIPPAFSEWIGDALLLDVRTHTKELE